MKWNNWHGPKKIVKKKEHAPAPGQYLPTDTRAGSRTGTNSSSHSRVPGRAGASGVSSNMYRAGEKVPADDTNSTAQNTQGTNRQEFTGTEDSERSLHIREAIMQITESKVIEEIAKAEYKNAKNTVLDSLFEVHPDLTKSELKAIAKIAEAKAKDKVQEVLEDANCLQIIQEIFEQGDM